MTNDEIRRNDEIRMTKPATAQLGAFGHSGFGFLSSLVIGHSSFSFSSSIGGAWLQGQGRETSTLTKQFMVAMHAKKRKGATMNLVAADVRRLTFLAQQSEPPYVGCYSSIPHVRKNWRRAWPRPGARPSSAAATFPPPTPGEFTQSPPPANPLPPRP